MLYLGLHCIRAWHREHSEISHLIKNVLKAFVTVPAAGSQLSGQAGRVLGEVRELGWLQGLLCLALTRSHLCPCAPTLNRGSWCAPITHPARGYLRLCIPGLQLVTPPPVCISTAAGKAQPPSREAAGLLCWQEAHPILLAVNVSSVVSRDHESPTPTPASLASPGTGLQSRSWDRSASSSSSASPTCSLPSLHLPQGTK